jgi:hypothetical protein
LAVDTIQEYGNPKSEGKVVFFWGGGEYFKFIPPFENKILSE